MAEHDKAEIQTGLNARSCRSFRPMTAAFSVGILIATCFGFCAIRAASAVTEPVQAERINPNTAPAASLMRLPGIGRVLATRITEFREDRSPDQPAFRVADDLQNIHGIGPVTVERLRPYLTFD